MYPLYNTFVKKYHYLYICRSVESVIKKTELYGFIFCIQLTNYTTHGFYFYSLITGVHVMCT